MARSFSQSLLAAAVAAVVAGSTLAQDTPLQEAVTLVRMAKLDEAVAKLREILAADPSNADALAMYRSVSQDEWYLLMTHQDAAGGASDIQKIAQSILERAKVELKQRSRDEATINELVAAATAKDGDFGARQKAINSLIANHGEFAVPALLQKLGNPDDADGQVHSIFVLQQMRGPVVLPLIEALKSSNEQAVQNAAAALFHIGDQRALPAMALLANDSRQGVASIATKFLAKFAAGATPNPVDSMLAQAKSYLKGNVPQGGFSEVVWSLQDDKLVATDVAALLYPSELAKAVAADAVRVAPTSVEARSMLAQANLAQANLIETSIAQGEEATKGMEPVAAELKITALATGVDALRSALEAGVLEGLAPVAVGAIQALATAELTESIGQSTLVAALASTDKRVRYAAAEALVRASGGGQVPEAERVVGVLAEAVNEQAVRTIQVIAPKVDANAAVEATSRVSGIAVDASSDAISGMRSLLINPNVDVVVVNEILPDGLPEDIIGNIKKDSRMANTRVVVIAKDVEQAKARFGDSVGVVAAPLTGESLIAAVNTALEGVSSPANVRAEGYATQASAALLAMAQAKGPITSAVAGLAQQLGRSDGIAVPAAKALGHSAGASELGALLAALAGGGSIDLKKACAEAVGNIVGRVGSCPDEVAVGLMEAMAATTDIGLRTSIAVALGKANLDGQRKADLLKKLNRIASAPAAGEG